MMTAQPPLAAVEGQPGVAAIALGDPATVMALQRRCIAPAIEEQQCLLTLVEALPQCRQQLR